MNAASDCPLALSLGALREGCAAIEAFGDLLASRRVGPRALMRAKVTTAEACVALVDAIEPFERTLKASLGDATGASAILKPLCDRLRSHMAAITTALGDGSPLTARHRLGLETLLRKYRADIKDCVALCDLAVAAAMAVPVELDLVSAMQQRRGDRVSEGGGVVVGLDVEATAIRTDRHVLAGLIEIAAAFVCRNGASEAHVTAATRSNGTFVVHVGPAPRKPLPGKSVTIVRRGELDLGLEVARMVARRSGLDITLDHATNTASITVGHRG